VDGADLRAAVEHRELRIAGEHRGQRQEVAPAEQPLPALAAGIMEA
jgi:hypothetical protein